MGVFIAATISTVSALLLGVLIGFRWYRWRMYGKTFEIGYCAAEKDDKGGLHSPYGRGGGFFVYRYEESARAAMECGGFGNTVVSCSLIKND